MPYGFVTAMRLVYLGYRWADAGLHVVMIGEMGLLVAISFMSLLAQELRQHGDSMLMHVET